MDMGLWVHVAAGSAALGSGAVALAARKGGRLHLRAGTLFFATMLVMAGTGALIALTLPERGTAVIGLFTCYLVATSWMTARRRDGGTGRFEVAALAVALFCAGAMATFVWMASVSPTGRVDSLPAAAHYPFLFLATLAACLDLNYMLRRRISGSQRIARHLWRMCAALLIAAFSFFLGQQDEFPEAWQGSPIWVLPGLLTFAAMVYWILRIRFAKAFRRAGALAAALAHGRAAPAEGA